MDQIITYNHPISCVTSNYTTVAVYMIDYITFLLACFFCRTTNYLSFNNRTYDKSK